MYPFYSLGIIAGLARDSGLSCVVRDMNIDFYNYLPDEEKKNWDDSMVVQRFRLGTILFILIIKFIQIMLG